MARQSVKDLSYFLLKNPSTTKYKGNLTRENSRKKMRNLITTLMFIILILMICKKDLYSHLDMSCHQLPEEIEEIKVHLLPPKEA